jgi:acid stress-induced BolA-like protein IbaG/YrbA
MQPEAVKALVEKGLPDCQVVVSGDGSHFDVTVIGAVFAGQSLLNKQRMVLATVSDEITSGALHAINIKAYTPEEWEKARKLQIS